MSVVVLTWGVPRVVTVGPGKLIRHGGKEEINGPAIHHVVVDHHQSNGCDRGIANTCQWENKLTHVALALKVIIINNGKLHLVNFHSLRTRHAFKSTVLYSDLTTLQQLLKYFSCLINWLSLNSVHCNKN